MKDFGSIIGFLFIVLIFALVTQGGDRPIFNNDYSFTNSSSTPTTDSPLEDTGGTSISSVNESVESPNQLSEREIEERLQNINRELGEIREEERKNQLRKPASPYQELVWLRGGNAGETRWSREYLTIYADSSAKAGIDVTGWYLESYVTKERTRIPEGDRVIEILGYPVLEHIILLPGEDAYLISGRPPFKTSFHENVCTGYLREEEEIYPSLNSGCPSPIEEMEKFSTVTYTNDACYDFVERIGQCEILEKDELRDVLDERDLSLSSSCRNFIVSELNYDGCVSNHKNDPLFDNVGSWYIYLGRTRDLWRSEREIIRLLDREGKVVDVIEY